MWQQFSDRARDVVALSQKEAAIWCHEQVTNEHLLLGIVRLQDCLAVNALLDLNITLPCLRSEIELRMARGNRPAKSDPILSRQTKRAIEFAYDESRQLNDGFVGTEHLLLALMRFGEGDAAEILTKLGARYSSVRAKIIDLRAERNRSAILIDTHTQQPGEAIASIWDDNMNELIENAIDTINNDTLGLRGKSLLSIADLSAQQLAGLLSLAQAMSATHKAGIPLLKFQYPKALAMIFEKPSLRTRVSFELGFRQFGGHPVVLGPSEIGLGKRESIPDVAHNLERFVNGIMARVFDHNTLIELDRNCSIPVINGLCDVEHPCQALADLCTILQKKGKLEGVKLAWVGDGNNVLHSLMLAGALSGMTVSAACPDGYTPSAQIVAKARALAGNEGRIQVLTDPSDAVVGADVVVTDTWISMGDEAEADIRRKAFGAYQVNSALLARAKSDVTFMHCLPAHRGEEVTDEVMDGPHSAIFDEAENRLHAQKAVMAALIGP